MALQNNRGEMNAGDIVLTMTAAAATATAAMEPAPAHSATMASTGSARFASVETATLTPVETATKGKSLVAMAEGSKVRAQWLSGEVGTQRFIECKAVLSTAEVEAVIESIVE